MQIEAVLGEEKIFIFPFRQQQHKISGEKYFSQSSKEMPPTQCKDQQCFIFMKYLNKAI